VDFHVGQNSLGRESSAEKRSKNTLTVRMNSTPCCPENGQPVMARSGHSLAAANPSAAYSAAMVSCGKLNFPERTDFERVWQRENDL
jgi:hypothetical protein